jgi:hypothetical protein
MTEQPPKTDADRNKATVDAMLNQFEYLVTKRGIWESHWQEVSQRVLPYYENSFYQQGNMTPGVKRGQDQYDTTATTALFRFAAAMESMITPANGKWGVYRCSDPDLQKIRSVALWFEQVSAVIQHYRYAPTANFQSQQHDGYVSLGAFGTHGMFVDTLDPQFGRGFRYRHCHLGELFLAVNHQGIVDTVYRRFKMTLRQMAQKWKDTFPADLKSQLESKPEEEKQIIHVVKPREDFSARSLTAKGMRYGSWWICKDTRTLLGEGGYHTFPYSVGRYITAPGEVYGRSPAMNVLPGIKVLNEEKKTVIKQGHRIVDPVLLAHDDGILSAFTLKPGAVNMGAVNAQGQKLVHALETGNLAVGKELMDDERLAINNEFMVTLFQILVETPQMTATEVLERAREKGALLSPTMGRQQSEAVGPMMIREFDIAMRSGWLPPPPPELVEARGQFKVEFDAPLNRAMRAEEAAGIMRTVQWAGEVSALTQDPSPMDNFDFDTILPEVASINGSPVRYLRDPALIAKIREGRAQAQAAQQMVQALPGVAAMVKAGTDSRAA